MNIAVIGLGYIGLPVAISLAEQNHHVIGFDTDESRLNMIKKHQFSYQEPELIDKLKLVMKNITLVNRLIAADIYIIAVQTPLKDDNKADLSYIHQALRSVSSFLKKDDLVVIESTIPPESNLTFIKQIETLSGLKPTEFDYAYCPETIQPGNIFFELHHNSRIVAATSSKAFFRAKELYSKITSGSIIETTFQIAEHVKILQNAYRDYEIAFANALSMYCDKRGINAFELIHLINQHPRVNILAPGVGVGGHCLPVDPLFITEKYDFEPIIFSRKLNDKKTDYVVRTIISKKQKEVVIFGASYKPNSDDTRNSPSLEIASKLKMFGINVCLCEPNINSSKIHVYTNLSINDAILFNGLFIFAQKHDIFVEYKHLLKEKEYLDFVGLFD